jgi:hypothetical protein
MTLRYALTAGLLVAALSPLAHAQPVAPPSGTPSASGAFAGEWEFEGNYSNRRRTEGTLTCEQQPTGWRVERTGWFTSQQYRGLPPFTWESTAVVEGTDTLHVMFRVALPTSGAAGALASAGAPSTVDPANVLVATYSLSGSGVIERVVNLTRRGPEAWWRSLDAYAARTSAPASALAPFVRAAERASDRMTALMLYLRVDFSDFGLPYNGPNGQAEYQADEQALDAYFAGATFEEVTSYPADWTAFKVLRAVNPVDPRGVVSPGEVYLMLDAQADVIEVVCKRGTHYYTSGGDRLPW